MNMKPLMEGWRRYLDEAGNISMVSRGSAHEEHIAQVMNSFFEASSIEYTATAEGGAGAASDVVVKDKTTGDKIHSYEIKTSKGSRIDFGQFRATYSESSGWAQATGLKNDILVTVFSEIKSILDSKIQGDFPSGPSLTTENAAEFWESYLSRPRIKSLSGDIVRVNISPSFIQQYYRSKGDDFIILGDDIYSLGGGDLPTLEGALQNCYVVFRIKYHSKNRYSYTMALRGKFVDTKVTDFATAIKKIYPAPEKTLDTT
jgi:hypothetical protein